MLRGFNHNIRHRGVLFHVQTEDSGLPRALVTTHVFCAGNVVGTARFHYAPPPAPAPAESEDGVRRRMEEQHKQALRDLVAGRFDDEAFRRAEAAPAPVELPDLASPRPGAHSPARGEAADGDPGYEDPGYEDPGYGGPADEGPADESQADPGGGNDAGRGS